MTGLLEQQRAFRVALLAGTAAPEAVAGGRVGPAARIGVYRNNVFGNLTGALRLNYPAVERLVGAEFFTGAAHRFIAAAPLAARDLHAYGEGFPTFLECFEPARGLAWLADVARLEWAVAHALHAPIVPSLEPAALANVPPAAEADIRFEPHPSLSLLALSHPARATWEAVLTADPAERAARLAGVDLGAGAEQIAVLSAIGGIALVSLSLAGLGLARALAGGESLGRALAAAPAEDAASLLATFLAHGFFRGFSLACAAAPATKGTTP